MKKPHRWTKEEAKIMSEKAQQVRRAKKFRKEFSKIIEVEKSKGIPLKPGKYLGIATGSKKYKRRYFSWFDVIIVSSIAGLFGGIILICLDRLFNIINH